MTAATGNATPSPEALRSILDQVGALASTYGRADLVERLNTAKDRLADSSVRVLVVGEYKKGKSTLVNGLLGIAVAPVDDDIATSIPTIVRFGDKARATVTAVSEGDGPEPAPEEIDVNNLAAYVSEAGNPANKRGLRLAEVWLNRRILDGGLTLVDTPGVGGLGSVHTAATLATLPSADAVIFVTDASQELTAPEVEFLRLAKRSCPNAVCVITKTDLYAEWQRMVELDQGHLARAGLEMPLLSVSSVLRQVALRTESKDTNAESGYPAVINYLRNDVVGKAADLAARSVLNDALRAVERMEEPFIAEAQSLAAPEKAQQMADKLTEAKADAERLRSQAARWQTTLSDGFGDLNSDVDQDLRNRMRETTRIAEEALDKSDPGKTWEEFRTWLTQRVTYDVVQNFSVIAERARELATLVGEHFDSEADEITPDFGIDIPSQTLESLTTADLDAKASGVAALGFGALRGAYSNISMFTMAGNMVHMAIGLTNPVTIVIGLLSGGKAVKDVRDREVTARRQQAKAAMRRYIDDVNFNVGKDFRDTIRHLQRQLRDVFAARAEELQRSTNEALTAVQQTAQKDQGERQARLQALDADLKKLATVKQRLAAMAPELANA